jgi:hypothetical protein
MLGIKDNTAIEYIILEKTGALEDKTSAIAKKKREKKSEKSKNKSASGFYFILVAIILGELWYLWNHFNPNL